MESESAEWRYEVKKNDPSEVGAALKDLLNDEDDPLTLLDIEDEYDCEVKAIIIDRDGKHEVINCNSPVHIDYKLKELKLPEEAGEVFGSFGWSNAPISARNIRYVGLPRSGNELPKNYGDVVVLSLWNAQRNIVNVYTLTENAKSSMLLANAVTRLIYETFSKSAIRTNKFYRVLEGPIDVAFCPSDELDKRDILKQKKEADKILERDKPSAPEDLQEEENLPDLIKTPMYFVFDEEAILLFENAFSFQPLHDFRFYREETPKSIDTIHVCNTEDQLEVQQGQSVYLLYPQKDLERSNAAYKELVEILRVGNVRPKSQDIFKNTGKEYEDFYNSPPEVNPKEGEEESSSEEEEEEPADIEDQRPMSTPDVTGSRVPDRRPVPSPAPARGSGGGQSWLNNLNSGEHLLANVSEEMQMSWFMAEAEIDTIIREGKVPESDISSSGLDPQSSQHLQTAVESIRDKLLSNQYAAAISQWRGCSRAYNKTLLSAASRVQEVEMLKRIYFLTG